MDFIKNRPFIALTILYCALLAVFDCNGFFLSPPKHDVARFISSSVTEVTGTVSGMPEQKYNKQIFAVKVSKVNDNPCRGTLLVHSFFKGEPAQEGDIIRFRCMLMRPFPTRNPGGYDYAERLRRMNIYAVTYISYFQKIGYKPLPFYWRLAETARLDMIETIQKTLPPDESAVLVPMLVGDKQSLSEEEKRAFTDAGVMHILVVSGLKVAYVAGTFLLLFRLVGFKRRFASLLTIPFLIIYMIATGNNPPVVRATIMAISIFISLSLKRESLTYQALALAAAAILIVDPQALFTASFQLSFAATIGIVYLYPYLIRPFQRFPAWFRNPIGGSVAVSLSSQLGVMPLLSYYFHKIFIAGIFSNIPIVPLTGIITGAGIVLYLIHFVSVPLTAFTGYIISLLIKLLLVQVHYFANIPYAAVRVATPAFWVIAAYYFFLIGATLVRRIRYMALILGVSGTLIAAGVFINHHSEMKRLEITSLYAGNGTAVHVAFPGNIHWLIDCGRQRDGERAICDYLWSKGIRRIDKIIITADDKRHAGGVQGVADNFPVQNVIYPASVIKREQYFINGSTVTVIPGNAKQENILTLLIDSYGKRTVFVHQEEIPVELTGITADVLHISCHGKQDILSCINPFTPGAVILSGTVPKNMPEMKNIYALNKRGAVSVIYDPKGINIKCFIKANNLVASDGED